MVSFCESVDLDVAVYADCAGAPMPRVPHRGVQGRAIPPPAAAGGQPQYGGRDRSNYFDAAAVDFDAELVLASMLPRGDKRLSRRKRSVARDAGTREKKKDSVAPPGRFRGRGKEERSDRKRGREGAVGERGYFLTQKPAGRRSLGAVAKHPSALRRA